MTEGQRTATPGFSRLLELLHSSYLRKGVRKSVADKLDEVNWIKNSVLITLPTLLYRQKLGCRLQRDAT